MAAKIIDGNAVAEKIQGHLRGEIEELKKAGKPCHLVAVQVGDNPGSRVYIGSQKKSCEEMGIKYTLDQMAETTTQQELVRKISSLNDDKNVTGIILQMPLPTGLDARAVQATIAVGKDVEGMNPANMGLVVYNRARLAPCTAMGAVELIKSTGVELYGREVTVVGHSEIVGKPISLLLLDLFCTTTVCHIATQNLKAHTLNADILVVAVGKPGLIKADMVKPGAIVIDIGINRVKEVDAGGKEVLNEKGKPRMKTVGDVAFEAVSQVAGMITPVPGGVGPMTVAMLLKNTVTAAKMAAGL